MSDKAKTHLLIIISAIAVLAAFFVKPIAQDPAYHQFADQRTLLGIPNMWDVLSNLPFVILGLYYGIKLRLTTSKTENQIIYDVFYLGFFLTGLGSGYYHLAPSNATLLWDRLPMTISFMAFFCFIIALHINQRKARQFLLPLLILGIFSVIYWHYTESLGRGDLRLYGLVQFLPLILIPMTLFLLPSNKYQSKYIWGVIGFYVAAKITEHLDVQIYTLLSISGHSIKHVLAAGAGVMFYQAVLSIGKTQEKNINHT